MNKTAFALAAALSAFGLGHAFADGPAVFVDGFNGPALNWTPSCNPNNPNAPPNNDACGPSTLDATQFQSPPTSAHLYAHGSCFTDPFDGVLSSLTKSVAVANGSYRARYWARSVVHHYDFCIGGTGGGTRLDANGINGGGAGCSVNACGTCTADWQEYSFCFDVTQGSADLIIYTSAGDCAENNGNVNDVRIAPLDPVTFATFPADVHGHCGDSTDPAQTGTATAAGGCAPTVSYMDSTSGACPGNETITRTWIITDRGSAVTSRDQTITLVGDSDGDGVPDDHDQCPNTPAGAKVDANGCSGPQLIAAACPTTSSYKNHGAYVSCVAHAAEAALGAGLITSAEKDAIVSAAAQSSVGKK